MTSEVNKEIKTEKTVDETKIAPEWLKAELFEKVLTENVPGYKKIQHFKAVPGTKAGDNYATVMLRVEIEIELTDGSIKEQSFMLKLPHGTDIYNDIMENSNVFDVERTMYTNYVAEFEQLYRNVGLDIKFGAKSYDLEVDKEYVLLEDLRPRGFKSVDRISCLDLEHTLSVLKKLAQWHAASAMRVETLGEYPNNHATGMFTEGFKGAIRSMTESLVPYVLKTLKHIEGHEAYYDDVVKMKSIVFDALYKAAEVDPNDFNVLNHGDCWLSNIMFQYDKSGKISETYLVDYQIPKYGTVAQDLLYFLISSTQLEIKLSKFDYFIKYYHDQLAEHLKLLNYPKKQPTLKELHTALIKYGLWGYTTATGVMAGVLVQPSDNAKFDNLFADTDDAESFKTLLFSGANYREHMKHIMPWLKNRGALEC